MSPQSGSKRPHTTDDETNSDVDIVEVHVSKAPKTERRHGRPKAGDFNDVDKELVLAAANIYRALLASQDAFPNTSMEVMLVKKAWKQMNAESGLKSRKITPSMVTFIYILIYVTIMVPRLRLEARNFGVKLKQKQPLLLKPCTVLTAAEANVQLQRTGRKLKS